eukprot:jgi/Tetstr1/449489/TSEL_036580.t1
MSALILRCALARLPSAAAPRRAGAPTRLLAPPRPASLRRALRRTPLRATAEEEGSAAPAAASAEQQESELSAFQQHQQSAARISAAEEARTMVAQASNGVLSTNSVSKISAGYPHGAVVELVADESGRPLISVSTLSLHTSDLQASSKCSITVTAQSFKDMSDARVTLTGDMVPVPEGECAAARELYLAKHPDAFYIDFGDFSFYRMDNVVVAHLNGGFARFSQIPGQSYTECKPDPIAPFSGPVAGHMNADHGDANQAIVKKYAGITVADAKILSLDRLGLNMVGSYEGMSMKIRVPFPRAADDRKDVKTLIVEMTKAAAEFMPARE